MYRHIITIFIGSLFAGCAHINAIPLNSDGVKAIDDAEEGFRYFLPRPYLIVTELPGSTTNSSPEQPVHDDPPGYDKSAHNGAPGAGAGKQQSPDDTTGKPAETPTKPADSSGDLGFIAQTPTYVAKLIYLPDYSQPMAVSMSTGLFGTASMSLTLQDGWNLTSVTANSDNSKLADVVIAALQAAASGATGGATTAAATAKKPTPPPGGGPSSNILKPGLYAFDFIHEQSRVAGLCAIAYFSGDGSIIPTANEKGACGPDKSRKVVSLVE